MEYEWDPTKAEQNLLKHGVTFDYATLVFLDPYRFDVEDRRRDYKKERRIALGTIGERVFSIMYTRRTGMFRLISARKAPPYDEAL